jgi:hypothetical protein
MGLNTPIEARGMIQVQFNIEMNNTIPNLHREKQAQACVVSEGS